MYARLLIMKFSAINILRQENLATPEPENSEIKQRQTSSANFEIDFNLEHSSILHISKSKTKQLSVESRNNAFCARRHILTGICAAFCLCVPCRDVSPMDNQRYEPGIFDDLIPRSCQKWVIFRR